MEKRPQNFSHRTRCLAVEAIEGMFLFALFWVVVAEAADVRQTSLFEVER